MCSLIISSIVTYEAWEELLYKPFDEPESVTYVS